MTLPPDEEHPSEEFPLGCKVKQADNSKPHRPPRENSPPYTVTGYQEHGGDGAPVTWRIETETVIDGKTRKGPAFSKDAIVRVDEDENKNADDSDDAPGEEE